MHHYFRDVSLPGIIGLLKQKKNGDIGQILGITYVEDFMVEDIILSDLRGLLNERNAKHPEK